MWEVKGWNPQRKDFVVAEEVNSAQTGFQWLCYRTNLSKSAGLAQVVECLPSMQGSVSSTTSTSLACGRPWHQPVMPEMSMLRKVRNSRSSFYLPTSACLKTKGKIKKKKALCSIRQLLSHHWAKTPGEPQANAQESSHLCSVNLVGDQIRSLLWSFGLYFFSLSLFLIFIYLFVFEARFYCIMLYHWSVSIPQIVSFLFLEAVTLL